MAIASLLDRYSDRLGIPLDGIKPDLETLCMITEAHLANIPFGNLGQHGCGETKLDLPAIATKLLTNNREGFCYEINLLLGELLAEIGYQVERLDADVAMGEDSWTPGPVHIWLLVTIDDKQYYTDVGFGESALHPLVYELDLEQSTPEGMVSRFTETDEHVVLEWKLDDSWTPRLRWNKTLIYKQPEDFQPNFNMVLGDKLPFHHKFVVVKVNRELKVSVAGTTLKTTQPRFGPDVKVEKKTLGNTDEVRDALETWLGIPKSETEGLDLTRSEQAPPALWSQF